MTTLLLIGIGGIAFLLAMMLILKVQPFVALLIASIAIALATGMSADKIVETVETGFGGVLGHVALIISLGAMIGAVIDESGGSEALAREMIRVFGDRRIPAALAVAAFLIGIPVFFEVGVVMLMPVAYGLARQERGNLIAIALPMCVTLLIVHALLPPHPGAVATAGLLHADIGRVLLLGLPIAAIVAACLAAIGRAFLRGHFAISEDIQKKITPVVARGAESDARPNTPPVGLVICLILVPVVLILGSAIASLLLPQPSTVLPALKFLGIPFIALLLDVLLCAYLLGFRQRWPREQISKVLSASIPGVAMVILITGGGAIFAKTLVTTGIGTAVADLLHASGLPLLVLGFLLTLVIRAIQGPTTVALTTVAGVIGPFVGTSHLSPSHVALLCLAMGSGGIAASNVNDPGFWIVTRMCGISVRDGLRTWTLLTTIAGIVGFGLTCLAWQLV